MSRLIPFVALFVFFGCVRSASAATTTRDIFFPTDPSVSLDDNFGELRAGHLHEGIDMMGEQMMPLYAAVNGRVDGLENPEASWGYVITLEDAEGYAYHYLHVNNDTPGTDDGAGGTANAYAPGISRGVFVTKGQLIGWMGDSGNAEEAGAHLHFEIREPNGGALNPYSSLVAARASGSSDTDEAAAEDLEIETVSNDHPMAVPLGRIARDRSGIRRVKLDSLQSVSAVVRSGLLRWIISPTVAASMYGLNWAKSIHDVSDALFGEYKTGEPMSAMR